MAPPFDPPITRARRARNPVPPRVSPWSYPSPGRSVSVARSLRFACSARPAPPAEVKADSSPSQAEVEALGTERDEMRVRTDEDS